MLNIQIENLVFGIVPPGEIARTTATGLLAAAGVSAALAWASTRAACDRSSNADATLRGNLWRKLPALGMLYIVLFLTAGSLILPYIREFYGRNNLIVMPSFGVLLLTEFVRGVVHAVSLGPFLRTMSGRRAQAALLAGLALPILGGISSLLLPIDDILPPEIRRVHIAESSARTSSLASSPRFCSSPDGRDRTAADSGKCLESIRPVRDRPGRCDEGCRCRSSRARPTERASPPTDPRRHSAIGR